MIALTTSCCALLFSGSALAETRNVMVHLFEWKWNDIKNECAYLEEKGYGGVQVSPPNEHAIKDRNPWWQRYQPVSYELNKSRSGTLAEFKSMVETCWKEHHVKIYVDAVINHMAGGDGIGSNGHTYQGGNSYYLYTKNGQEVRYDRNDFHQQCDINWSKNPVPADEIQRCWIGGGLPDLKTEDTAEDKVKNRIVDFLNSMIDMGVAGFRIDAAKHMHPADIVSINNRLKNLRSEQGWFAAGERPFIYQEVINGDRQEVTPEQYTNESKGKKQNILEFRYGQIIGKKFRRDSGESPADLLTYNFPAASKGWGMVDSAYAVVFTDNHDNQRGHGNGFFTAENNNAIGGILTHYYDASLYNLANVFMLAWPYGTPQIMSSYQWERNVKKVGSEFKDINDWMGPPSDSNGNTQDVNCNKGWICEHRWGSIAGMVGFNNYTQDAWKVGYKWIGGPRKIAFARVKPDGVSSGFVVINADNSSINASLNTGLPAGSYCDVAHHSYNFNNKTCSGSPIEVDHSGFAQFNVAAMQASALHVGAQVCPAEGCQNSDNWDSAFLVSSANQWLSAPMKRLNDDEWQIEETFSDSNPRFKVCRYKNWSTCEPLLDKPITDGLGKYTITFNSRSKTFAVKKETSTVTVNFTCNLGYTYWGTSVYVVGNHTDLGNWKVRSAAQKLSPSRYPTWTGSLQLPKATRYEWKCVKARESDLVITQWAPGANVLFSTESLDTATLGSF